MKIMIKKRGRKTSFLNVYDTDSTKHKNQNAKHNPIPSKYLKIMFFDIVHQKLDDKD